MPPCAGPPFIGREPGSLSQIWGDRSGERSGGTGGIDNSGVVFSALAVGAGVVLSDVGGFRELHQRDGVGALVAPGDAAALAATLIEVLTSPARRDALRTASRNAADGRLSWGEIAEANESVYRELV